MVYDLRFLNVLLSSLSSTAFLFACRPDRQLVTSLFLFFRLRAAMNRFAIFLCHFSKLPSDFYLFATYLDDNDAMGVLFSPFFGFGGLFSRYSSFGSGCCTFLIFFHPARPLFPSRSGRYSPFFPSLLMSYQDQQRTGCLHPFLIYYFPSKCAYIVHLLFLILRSYVCYRHDPFKSDSPQCPFNPVFFFLPMPVDAC